MADETRVRILDACVAILARGVAELSIPAVAREAGVSVPTVYRNFPDKKTLLAETAAHLRRARGVQPVPDRIEDIEAVVRANFEGVSSVNETVAAALASEPINALRRDTGHYQQRLGMMEALLAPHLRDVSPAERENAVLMATVLCSSHTLRAFKEMTTLTPKRAAEVVAFAIARLIGRESLDDQKPVRKTKGKAR